MRLRYEVIVCDDAEGGFMIFRRAPHGDLFALVRVETREVAEAVVAQLERRQYEYEVMTCDDAEGGFMIVMCGEQGELGLERFKTREEAETAVAELDRDDAKVEAAGAARGMTGTEYARALFREMDDAFDERLVKAGKQHPPPKARQ
jgi:hypothetical protein